MFSPPPVGLVARINRDSPHARGLYRWWPADLPRRNGSKIEIPEKVNGVAAVSIATNESPTWRAHPEVGWYVSPNTHSAANEYRFDVHRCLRYRLTG